MQNCPLCKSNNQKKYTDKLRFGKTADVLKCDTCDLVFLDQNSFQFPKDFYETEYHQTYLTHVDPEILDPQKYYEKMQKASSLWISRVRDLLSGTEKVLDVGCSTGHLITGIKDKAAYVYGHELSRKEVDFCKNTLGIDVDSKPLSERFKPESFDVITLIFVFEHIGNPVEFLEELKTYLKPSGKLVIVVPSIQDPLVSLYDIPELREFYFCIEHLFYYSAETLKKTLELAGFNANVELVQEYPITNHLNWMYRKKPSETLAARSDIPDVEVSNQTTSNELSEFWNQMNYSYKEILLKNGYSDRLWCVAEKIN